MNYGNKARTRRKKAHNKERREREGEIVFRQKRPSSKNWRKREQEYLDRIDNCCDDE